MGRKYANPPLKEAVCEFRLAADSPWDLTMPGLIYEKLRDEFPRRDQRLVQEIEITQSQQGLQQQIRTSERILLLTEDRRIFVQLGPRLLAVHCLQPYPTWDGFKPKIDKALTALVDTIGDAPRLQRIGLRYINQIELPSASAKLEDYFEFYLFLGPRLPRTANFIAGCEFTYSEGRDLCRVQLRTSDPSKPSTLTLDIDYFLAKPGAVGAQEAIGWVESAHDEVEQVFEGCITDRLRQVFGEVN
ncbi:MAG: TIGR04255 family protein [Clostridia bacterium]|nr:TIGR04255 family protein [Clostridia bacterium]